MKLFPKYGGNFGGLNPIFLSVKELNAGKKDVRNMGIGNRGEHASFPMGKWTPLHILYAWLNNLTGFLPSFRWSHRPTSYMYIVQFKVLILVLKTPFGVAPGYLCDLILCSLIATPSVVFDSLDWTSLFPGFLTCSNAQNVQWWKAVLRWWIIWRNERRKTPVSTVSCS